MSFKFLFLTITLLALVFSPMPGLAAEGWVQCDPTKTIGQADSCDLCALLATVQTIINSLIELAFVAAVGLIIYNGVMFYFSEGNPGKVQAILQNLMNVAIGIAIIIAAWMIINTLIRFFAGSSSPLQFWNTLNC